MSSATKLESEHQLWAIVPAAGIGQRMQADVAKQYLTVHGKTILEHSLSALLLREDIRQLVLCVAEHDTTWPSLEITKDARVINTLGGESRAESVLNGLRTLAAVADQDDWVLVHDAARPCLDQDSLNNLVLKLRGHPVGGILAVPAQDTLKRIDDSGKINATVDRERIFHAQTPQMFRFGLLHSALSGALEANLQVTDECSAVELAGYSPMVVEGNYLNLKVTRPADLQLVEAILAGVVSK